MDLKVSLLIDRAENEILAAQALKRLSEENELKLEFSFPSSVSFYSSVISHSYYAVFYSAKAYLLARSNLILQEQGQHQQVYFEFRKLVKEGILSEDLLNIYEDIKGRAEVLLEIIKTEKEKRKNFSYETIPQANKQPADDSLTNALFFVSHIKQVLNNKIKEDEKE